MKARLKPAYEQWLHHIHAFDYPWMTFILDDCHLAPEQVGELLNRWPDIKHARLLLVSRPADASLADTGEESFIELLEPVRLSVEPDADTISRIVESILAQEHCVGRDPGPLQRVLERCSGDLWILEFLVRAWIKQPEGGALADVPDNAILDNVYKRYLEGKERYRREIVKIAALYQFEIPVESRWIDDPAAVAALQADAYVERFTTPVEGVPIEFLKYFHATPAQYVVRAAFSRGILQARKPDEYVLRQLSAYVVSLPANFFEVFLQLFRNGGEDLQVDLFSNGAVLDTAEQFIKAVHVPPSLDWLYEFARFVYGVSRWDGTGSAAKRFCNTFKARVPEEERRVIVGAMAQRAVLCRGGRRMARAAEGNNRRQFFAPEADLDVPSGFAKNGDALGS